jgi:hypothetical protein
MGRNLLCIFSKKHIENPPELKVRLRSDDLWWPLMTPELKVRLIAGAQGEIDLS